MRWFTVRSTQKQITIAGVQVSTTNLKRRTVATILISLLAIGIIIMPGSLAHAATATPRASATPTNCQPYVYHWWSNGTNYWYLNNCAVQALENQDFSWLEDIGIPDWLVWGIQADWWSFSLNLSYDNWKCGYNGVVIQLPWWTYLPWVDTVC
jgi:hypothetical protein